MHARIHFAARAAAALALSAAARAQYLMATDATGDRVLLLNRSDGSIFNGFFITDDASGVNYDFLNPYQALQVGAEIWVSDQSSDQIVRFDSLGAWRSTITTGIDQPRGMVLASNGLVYVCNNGTQHQAPGAAVIAFNAAGVKQFHFLVTTPTAISERNGELLVSNVTTHDLARYSFNGTFLGNFHDSTGTTGIKAPAQTQVLTTGVVQAAGSLGSFQTGLYEYSSAGAQINYFQVGSGVQGLAPLGNNDIVFGDATGLHIYERANAFVSDLLMNAACNYISEYSPPAPPTVYCTSGTSSHGCVPQITTSGAPSIAAGSGFTITIALSEGLKNSLIFYGTSTQFSAPWGTGGTSFLCVKAPLQRTLVMNSGGTLNTCNGTFGIDWCAFIATHPTALGNPFSGGELVQAQGWYRDPGVPKNTSLTQAVEFTTLP